MMKYALLLTTLTILIQDDKDITKLMLGVFRFIS